ncbi:DUF938 domain-containing protein [Hirschia baltica]|uniref:SAM-dependent methyltransferase n=1 Tax=Hirschia baltica (strain ATCC 49814 / DSM 5838 / IFAM 1418) TaxID=582402 RepID=C6XI56_HIRBI|nr:DUF938 domain-containing protein [Hirschia baltica]ACT58882.1 protein of unknown function DUF938 [Hirschia baltica ATCC 49814]
MQSENKPEPFKINPSEDGRQFSPSIERNRDVIKSVFLQEIPANARVLEIASGTGQHAAHILKDAPDMRWIASDLEEQAQISIRAWAQHAGVEAQYEEVKVINAANKDWGIDGKIDAILSCNMLHISPWEVSLGMFAGAKKYLNGGGRLFLYGPFKRNGQQISESNTAFDVNLRDRNSHWGIRDLEGEVISAAKLADLHLVNVHDMPANNFSVVFEHARV